MALGGQFLKSVRSIWAIGVSPKALSGGGAGRGGNSPRSVTKAFLDMFVFRYVLGLTITTSCDVVRHYTTLYDVVLRLEQEGQAI